VRQLSPVATEAERVVLLPSGQLGSVVVAMTLADTTVLFAGAGKTTGLPALVDWIADPVDPGVPADGLVVGVDKDDLVVFVDTILVYPVRVQDTQIAASPANTFLCDAPQAPLGLEVVDTLANGLAVGSTLRDVLLAVTPPHANTVDDIALLGLVAQAASFVGTRRARSAVNDVQLAVLPAADAEEEAKDIRLLLLVELTDILVRTHRRAW